jgi:hypothetical protein
VLFTVVFGQRNWGSGRVWLDFILPGTDPRNQEWEQLQVHRRPVALLGLLHCPSTPDLATGYKLYQDVRKRYPRLLRSRCFAFEPLEWQSDSVDRSELILFPNSSAAQLRFYMSTLLGDLTAFLLQDLEQQVVQIDDIKFFNTPLEPDKCTSSNRFHMLLCVCVCAFALCQCVSVFFVFVCVLGYVDVFCMMLYIFIYAS